ncbi:MAG: Arc family DNA-binding protein [Rubrivivax sp.]|nr:Arc family DNA-binding protein [Rubrivivax sp.]
MSVSLSIKDVPEALAERLRLRAARNHRSLQRELMAIVEAAVEPGVGVVPLQDTGGRATTAPVAAHESDGVYAVTAHEQPPGVADDLLAELDAIVACSRWGSAPLLTREQAHDRALARELDFEARTAELADARRRQHHGGAA